MCAIVHTPVANSDKVNVGYMAARCSLVLVFIVAFLSRRIPLTITPLAQLHFFIPLPKVKRITFLVRIRNSIVSCFAFDRFLENNQVML